MNLIYDKSGKPDTRQADTEQLIVRLGIERAGLEREVGALRGGIDNLGKRRDDFLIEIAGKQRELVEYDQKLNAVRDQIAAEFRRGTLNVDDLKKEEELFVKVVDEKRAKITELNEHLAALIDEIDAKNTKLTDLQQSILRTRNELAKIAADLLEASRQLECANIDLKEAYQAKKKVKDLLDIDKIELNEIQGMIESLKRNNRGGLDALASLEAERQRLRDLDDFLRRKEADLLVYENRLRKRMDEAGVTMKMTFT